MTSGESIDPELLRNLQGLLAKLLVEFDRVCRDLGLPYVVYGGTAIGAVRHQGFIPWDDDADVCMLRSDYERLLEEAPRILGPEFSLENSRTHADFPNMFSFLTLKGTRFLPQFVEQTTYQMPVALDIFPLDEIPADPRQYRRQIRAAWFWGRVLYLQGTPKPYVAFAGWRRRLVHTVAAAAYWSMRALRVKPRSLQKRWERAARRFEGAGTGRFTDFTDLTPQAWEVSKENLFPPETMPFEDIRVKVPRQYDEVLRRGYGDYMTLPPPPERKTHQPVLVDLGEHGWAD